jgi:hypothetical protein
LRLDNPSFQNFAKLRIHSTILNTFSST